MMTVLQTIRILVIIQLLTNTRCQDGFGDRDILRFQQMSSDDGQIETITGYSIIPKEQNNQAVQSSQQYQQYADSVSKNEDYNRTGRRKVYRIRNPFQNRDDNERPENTDLQDSSTGASNQYAAMQYSLPPEEFLQQLRAENQYYQQQQVSTPAPNLGFTVTPQPQYQYSTTSTSNYDSNNQNQIQLQAKITPSQSYSGSYQYSTPYTFLDNIQSTPSPVSYLSTPMNTGQYVGTQPSTYVSSASPIYLSSPPNFQQYVSSPLSAIQTHSDYNSNRITTTMGSNSQSYDNDPSKNMQQEHYDYSANNYRYPVNNQQQYQNDYTSTTTTSSPYLMRESSWQNAVNSGANALSKSLQEVSFTQYQNYPYNNNQQEVRTDTSSDNSNSDTNRIGNLASANNIYMNYAQPENQIINNLKIRTRDLETETGQKELYSNGDYGWKLNDKKQFINNDVYSFDYPKYQMPNLSSDSVAVSQMSFHMDTGKSYNNGQVKPVTESIESQEFAKAAAKAHDRYKQQHQYYTNNYGYNNEGNSYYTIHDKQNKYTDNTNQNTNQYMYSNTQNDLVTASPFLISNSRDNGDNKSKQPFDHNKALKNIVPIDVSNVVSNSGSALKQSTNSDYNNRFSTPNYGKDQLDQSVRQYIRPISDSYFKDKNTVYNFNTKAKPDDYVTPDSLKQIEAAIYAKQQQIQDQSYNQGSYTSPSQNYGYNPQASNYQDGMQSSSAQQPGLQRNHNTLSQDIVSLLKLNDVPYRFSQGLSNDALKLHNNKFEQGANLIPTPIPTRINQNVDSHQLDVATNLINKLLLNKQAPMAINRPIESDSQTSLLPTINGFKVANPFNLDLKLVADMLKGKPTVDDSYMMSMRDTFTKPTPLKFDLSQLQHLLNNENTANLGPINDGLSALTNPYMDIYNNGRYPYQGVKYSRSQEEEESLPISDSTNNHPIGAVIEQDDTASEREVHGASDLTGQGDDAILINFDETRPKHLYIPGHRNVEDRHRNSNSLSGRHSYHRKYPKNDIEEPYPLLKPPPRHSPVARSNHMKMEKNRRRRVTRPKILRVMKTESMFESGVNPESSETSVPILLRPPSSVAKSKSDTDLDEKSS